MAAKPADDDGPQEDASALQFGKGKAEIKLMNRLSKA